jgi:predicted transcriptional regulator
MNQEEYLRLLDTFEEELIAAQQTAGQTSLEHLSNAHEIKVKLMKKDYAELLERFTEELMESYIKNGQYSFELEGNAHEIKVKLMRWYESKG